MAHGQHAAQDGCECDPTQIISLLRTLSDIFVIMCHNVFNVWPKTTLLPVWHRDAKRLCPTWFLQDSGSKPGKIFLASLLITSQSGFQPLNEEIVPAALEMLQGEVYSSFLT